ncbi:antibiotic biosynthesis monooxygenase [Cellulophaga sp. HaHaR_3_176]|uniref:antibiotic biosynthesis monooxygenase family protein n=1 Tax=Cellulophaga sp. HaHaR_3_176 TaxID=1942464 RepID=UPI001C1F2066|nr:antibiotic biosynthesis monooxygenase [Cellulophaga sp. HaHaR_3_176]QWX83413.1 antibiotic biosynthesis monooxygenase [Cellulophaga sp. HaHaR_3_176]
MEKPYYAVIFTSTRTSGDHGYGEMAEEMERLAKNQSGFLGIESARESVGITVSYWTSLAAIADWKTNADHLFAQRKGVTDWYKWYKVRICLVEREYEFEK